MERNLQIKGNKETEQMTAMCGLYLDLKNWIKNLQDNQENENTDWVFDSKKCPNCLSVIMVTW